MKNEELFNRICMWFGYWYDINENGEITDITEENGETITRKYNNLTEALKEWVTALVTDEEENGVDWSKEIKYINGI